MIKNLNIKTVFIVLLFVLLAFSLYKIYINQKNKNTKPLSSQIVMQRAMQIVREKKPTPVQSSSFYAVVAKGYYENLNESVNLKTKQDINIEIDFATTTLETILKSIVDKDNANSEGFTLKTGPEYWNATAKWTKEAPKPFSPRAELLPRFILGNDFKYLTPAPPVYGSEEFNKGLSKVADASSKRTPEQNAFINFWGGIPGSEAPAGIWQNRLMTVSKKYNLSDTDYAYAQMILAESVADSFMECWKVKYAYQTKRPDMTDKTINVAMPNPPFPGYVSGHSTISFTAATILSALFPKDSETYLKDAYNAKDSRLNAGIHFPYDNDEGEKLGRAVGEYVVKKLDLKEIK